MKLLFSRCEQCFPENKYPFFQYEVGDNDEAFEGIIMQCTNCLRQLRCLGKADKF